MSSDFDLEVFRTLCNTIDLIALPQPEALPSLQYGDCVPQRVYKGGSEYNQRFEPDSILFFLQDGSFLPVNAALEKNCPDLLNGSEQGFLDPSTSTNVTVRFEWPGYPPKSYQLKTVDQCKQPKRLTVSKIAGKIAKLVSRFIKEMENEPIAPEHARWQVGLQGDHIDVQNLRLASLDRVSGGSWQPRLFYRPSQRACSPMPVYNSPII